MLFPLAFALAATGDTGAPLVDSALVDTAVVDPAPPAAYTRPVGYWPLDEADSVAVELANDREGILFGTTDVDGPAGPAQAFDGGAWAELGTHLYKMTTGDDARFTLGLWLYPEGGPGVLWSKSSHPSVCAAADTAAEFLARLDPQGRVVVELFGDAGGLLRVRSVDPVPPEAWSHLVIVHDSAAPSAEERVQLYLDGLPWAADLLRARGGRFPIPNTDAPLALGAQLDVDGVPCATPGFVGALDEAAVFNVALGPGQVEAVHARSAWGASLLAEDDPQELVFVLDLSCSMGFNGGMLWTDQSMEAAASLLAEEHGPADMVSAVIFSDRAQVWTDPFVIADDPDALLAQWSTFGALTPRGSTNHTEALLTAREILSERADRGYLQGIVLVTDGNPTVGTEAERLAEVDAVRAAGIHVWTLGFGSSINVGLLASYAHGYGTYEHNPDASGLVAVLTNILDATP